jgi:transcriptional regulator with XRE-family HTH domain
MSASQSADLGGRIRQFREDRGLSLSQLAANANISKGYLWSLENEDTPSRPSANTLFAISEALGVLMSDLFGRTLTHETDEVDIPESLRKFAEEKGLPDADVLMLATVQFRGETPTTVRRWEYIYNAIRHSKPLDDE